MHADQMIAIRNKLNALERIEHIINDPKTDHDLIIAIISNIESLKKQMNSIEDKLDLILSGHGTTTIPTIENKPKKQERKIKEYMPSFDDDIVDIIQIKKHESLSESIQDTLEALHKINIDGV